MSQNFRIKRDKLPDLAFEGERVACVSSDSGEMYAEGGYIELQARARVRGRDRWTELELYRTKGGKWIAVTIGRSRVEGETDRHAAVVCKTEREVFRILGMGRLARNLYVKAELDPPAEWVD